MALKIKDNKNTKVSLQPQREGKISFNFMYLTNKKDFNFDYFAKDKSNKLIAYSTLHDRMQELSNITMQECKARYKTQGAEAIGYKSFNKGFQSILDNVEIVSKDSSLSVIRFNQNNYRMICKTGIMDNNVLYVIGFDFNYSAYDHG